MVITDTFDLPVGRAVTILRTQKSWFNRDGSTNIRLKNLGTVEFLVISDQSRPFELWPQESICLAGVSSLSVSRSVLTPAPLPIQVDWIVPD